MRVTKHTRNNAQVFAPFRINGNRTSAVLPGDCIVLTNTQFQKGFSVGIVAWVLDQFDDPLAIGIVWNH